MCPGNDVVCTGRRVLSWALRLYSKQTVALPFHLFSSYDIMIMFSDGCFGSCEAGTTKCRLEVGFPSPVSGVVASNGVRLGKGKGYGDARSIHL